MGPHLTREEISEAAEDLLPADRRQAVEDHLADCESCRAVRAEILGVRGLLRAIATERPAMPDEVTDRLLAAIAAEARRPRPAAVPAGESRDASAETVTPLSSARSGRSSVRSGRRGPRRAARASRMLAAAAAVALMAIGGTLGYHRLTDDSASTTATGPDRTATTSREPAELPPTGKPEATSRPRTMGEATNAYVIVGAPKLSSARFDVEVVDVIRPASEVPDASRPPRRQPVVGNCPGHAVARAGGGTVLDQASATFDRGPADLVITRSRVAGAVEAYVVTGCPRVGKIAHHRTIRLPR